MIVLLRILIPLVIFFMLALFLWSRFKRYRHQKSDRIEVEAEVISSEQHAAPKVSDIPTSPTTPNEKEQ